MNQSNGAGKRGHIVADTLLLMMFLGRANARTPRSGCLLKSYSHFTKRMFCFHAAQTGKHLLRTQNVSEQNQKPLLCPGHKICARANGETFVSATMCPQQCVLVCQGLKVSTFINSSIPVFVQNYLNVIYNLLLHFLEWPYGYSVLYSGSSRPT